VLLQKQTSLFENTDISQLNTKGRFLEEMASELIEWFSQWNSAHFLTKSVFLLSADGRGTNLFPFL